MSDGDAPGGRPVPRIPLRRSAEQFVAVADYEFEKRRRGVAVLTVLLSALAALDVAFFPSLQASGVDLDEYMESLPPAMRELFGGVSLGTIEGFLVAEFYQFAWVLLLGMYVAYRAGGLLAGDVERDRMDLLLSTPVSRRVVVLGKYGSLVPALVVLNAVLPAVVYVAVGLVGESIAPGRLVMVHLLSFPYLLACGAAGVLASAVASKADVGQRAGMGVVFAMYLLDSATARTGVEWVARLTFPHYYDSAPVLTAGEYDLAGAAVLLAAAAALVGVAAWQFDRRDV